MEKLTVKIINKSRHQLPEYKTPGSAGMDIRANISQPIQLMPGERALVGTGLFVQLPEGYEIQLRPRSGNALKLGITLANTPGTIDSDYRGEIGVIIINLGYEPIEINDGDRIAQAVVKKYEVVEWLPVDTLDDTERGSGAYGHTGTN